MLQFRTYQYHCYVTLCYITFILLHGKSNFVEISKNLDRYKSENNIVGLKNNYIGNSSMISNAAKCFGILTINLNVLHT